MCCLFVLFYLFVFGALDISCCLTWLIGRLFMVVFLLCLVDVVVTVCLFWLLGLCVGFGCMSGTIVICVSGFCF